MEKGMKKGVAEESPIGRTRRVGHEGPRRKVCQGRE